jgi:hypothetical protein
MEINLRDNWDRLSAATRQWLTDNPECLILPVTRGTASRLVGLRVGMGLRSGSFARPFSRHALEEACAPSVDHRFHEGVDRTLNDG